VRQLSGLDASFLYLESLETPMHVGSLHLYGPVNALQSAEPRNSKRKPPKSPKPVDFHSAVQEHLTKRLHLSSIFTRKLTLMPFSMGHPVWQKVDSIDIDYHVRKVILPKPGTIAQLHLACAKLHSQLMDRNRPLWQFTIFEGLQNGHWAFYSKIHHAALDGKGGTVLANAVLDLSSVPRDVPPPDQSRTKSAMATPNIGRLMGAVFSNTIAQYAKIIKAVPAVAGSISSSLASSVNTSSGKSLARSVGSAISNNIKSVVDGGGLNAAFVAPKIITNRAVSAHRVFSSAQIDLVEAKRVGKALGGSLNDVVLFICSTAMRNYLHAYESIPRKSLVAAMPVSLRAQGNQDMGNQASMVLVELGTNLANPKNRWDAICTSTGKVKRSMGTLKNVLPTDYPSLLAPWLVGGLSKAYGGIANRIPMVANLVISNVPGPTVPLYLAGAQMLTFHPLSIIIHGIALNITVQSYNGSLDFGVVGCKAAIEAPAKLATMLEAAFIELSQLEQKLRTGRISVETKLATTKIAKK
jgi:diacylglycerol O-acyltransferase / wax synthase